MPITIMTRDARTTSERARADGDDLWLPADELEAATGWELQPEGCAAGRCAFRFTARPWGCSPSATGSSG